MTNDNSSKTYWFSALVVIAGIVGFIYFIIIQGKGNQSEEISVCSCKKGFDKMQEELQEAVGDEDKTQKINEKFDDLKKMCEKLTEGISVEEIKKMVEESKNCP